jgi:hypothetical protein
MAKHTQLPQIFEPEGVSEKVGGNIGEKERDAHHDEEQGGPSADAQEEGRTGWGNTLRVV